MRLAGIVSLLKLLYYKLLSLRHKVLQLEKFSCGKTKPHNAKKTKGSTINHLIHFLGTYAAVVCCLSFVTSFLDSSK